jgi:hypothetical protein
MAILDKNLLDKVLYLLDFRDILDETLLGDSQDLTAELLGPGVILAPHRHRGTVYRVCDLLGYERNDPSVALSN